MLEEKVKMLEEKVKMLEGDKDKDKKPERYTIATPASSVVEGSDIGSDKSKDGGYDGSMTSWWMKEMIEMKWENLV